MVRQITRKLWHLVSGSAPPRVSVLRLSGAIGIRTGLNRGLSLASVAEQLDKLFEDDTAAAVAIIINSPGGSPVQAALIHDRIRRLAAEADVPVLAFAEDVAASGGYMLALAGDEIYAHENSIVGSIGVVSEGFGFHQMIEKLGIERRVHTSGERKAMLDPFRPEDPRDAAHLEALQREVHESFKALVRKRREGRLKGDEAEMFSGMFWTGTTSASLGLIDGTGDLRSVCEHKFGEKVEFRLVQPRKSWFNPERSGISAPALPLQWADGLLGTIEERALWARYGL
ncbi:MAG: S49 family peptidase [Alphaproteobacteria bacterium]|jgi:signal peptide peptidase SppA